MTYQLNSDHRFIYDLSSDLGSMDGLEAVNLLSCMDNNQDSWSLYEENSVPSSGPAAAVAARLGHSSFTHRTLQQWSPQNCLEWGIHICQKYNIDKLYIDIGTLGQTNGPQLMKSTQSDFCILLGDQYGHTFYKELQKLKKTISTEVNGRYLDIHNSSGIDQSQYSVNLDPYTPSMESYPTNYRFPNSDNNSEMGQSHYNVPLDQCITTMDSFSTTFRSPYNDNNTTIKQSPSYSVNSGLCIPIMESYSTNYKSPYSDNNARIDQSPYTVKSEECITSMDSYTTNYKSPYSDNSAKINQSPYTVKSEECITSMDSYSENYKSPYSDNKSQDSVKSEFELNGNLEDFDSESDVTIDYDDSTWDLPEETWKQIDITNLNLDLNFDQFALENTDMIDSPTKVKRKSGKGQARKKITKSKKSTQEINFSADCVEGIIKKTHGAAKRERFPRSWEFCMRLLGNSETNPSVIRWEDESQYIFRLVKPEAVIQIWNEKSEKSSPNKDNFARSLRYHYKKGILIPVPEKQLVYQCGPKAIEYVNDLRKTL